MLQICQFWKIPSLVGEVVVAMVIAIILWLVLLIWLADVTVRFQVSDYNQLYDFTVRFQPYTIISEK